MSVVVESNILSIIVNPEIRTVAAVHMEDWMFSYEWSRTFLKCIKQQSYNNTIPAVREFVVDLHTKFGLSQEDCEYAAQILIDYVEPPNVEGSIQRLQDWISHAHVHSGIEILSAGNDKGLKERGIEAIKMGTGFQIAVDTFYDFSSEEAINKAREEDLPEGTRIIPSSFNVINKASTYGGLKYGDLIMIAAESGLGKSTAIITESAHHARNGFKVANFVLGDMTEHDMFLKYLSNFTKTDTSEILLNGHQKYMTPEVVEWFRNIRVKAFAPDAFDIYQLMSKAEQLHKKFKFDVLTIDYDGNIKDTSAGGNTYLEGGAVYANAKGYGKGKCVVYIASQTKIQYWGEEIVQKFFANDSSKKQHHIDYMVGFGKHKDCPIVGTINLPKVRRGRADLRARIHLDNGKARIYEIRAEKYEEIKHQWVSLQREGGNTFDLSAAG